MNNSTSVGKKSCPTCKLCRCADEARKHPSQTSASAVQNALNKLRKFEGFEHICVEHSTTYRDTANMVVNWTNRALRMAKRTERVAIVEPIAG